MCAHSWKWQSKYPMGYRTLLNIQQQQDNTNEGNLNGNIKTTNDIDDNFIQFTSQQQRKEHFLDIPMMDNKMTNGISLKTKIFKGKRFALEVNNNEEDIIV